MDAKSDKQCPSADHAAEAKRLADALENKEGDKVKWTEEFAASGGGKGNIASVEP